MFVRLIMKNDKNMKQPPQSKHISYLISTVIHSHSINLSFCFDVRVFFQRRMKRTRCSEMTNRGNVGEMKPVMMAVGVNGSMAFADCTCVSTLPLPITFPSFGTSGLPFTSTRDSLGDVDTAGGFFLFTRLLNNTIALTFTQAPNLKWKMDSLLHHLYCSFFFLLTTHFLFIGFKYTQTL